MNKLEVLKAVQKIAFAITDSNLAKIDLTCPNCNKNPVIFSFTVNRPPKYGLYIHCKNCGLLHHFHFSSKPPNFREELILPYYQQLEHDAMLFASSFDDHSATDNKS